MFSRCLQVLPAHGTAYRRLSHHRRYCRLSKDVLVCDLVLMALLTLLFLSLSTEHVIFLLCVTCPCSFWTECHANLFVNNNNNNNYYYYYYYRKWLPADRWLSLDWWSSCVLDLAGRPARGTWLPWWRWCHSEWRVHRWAGPAGSTRRWWRCRRVTRSTAGRPCMAHDAASAHAATSTAVWCGILDWMDPCMTESQLVIGRHRLTWTTVNSSISVFKFIIIIICCINSEHIRVWTLK